jgi:hypothetical protein
VVRSQFLGGITKKEEEPKMMIQCARCNQEACAVLHWPTEDDPYVCTTCVRGEFETLQNDARRIIAKWSVSIDKINRLEVENKQLKAEIDRSDAEAISLIKVLVS